MSTLKSFFSDPKLGYEADLNLIKWVLNATFFNTFDENLLQKKSKLVLLVLNTTFMVTVILSCAYSVQYIIGNSDLLMECFFSMLLIIESLVRMAALFFYRQDLIWLMHTILHDIPKNEFEYKVMKKCEKIIRIIMVTTLVLYIGSGFLFIIVCLFSSNIHSMPFYVLFFGTQIGVNPDYIINLFLSYYLLFIFESILNGFDMLFCFVSIYIISRMICCENDFSKIGKCEDELSENQAKVILNSAIFHEHIKKMVLTCSKIFHYVALVQLLCSMGFCCFILFYVREKFTYNNSFLLLAANSWEFFLYCYLGQYIMDKANDMNLKLYSSDWYKISNINDRKHILFVLMNTQKDVGYSAGGFAFLSMSTYATVLSKAMSFLAVMLNIMN